MGIEVRRGDGEYELLVDGEHAGKLEVQDRDGAVELVHTYVDEAFGGRGLAGTLAQAVLDDLRVRGEKAIATCPYVQGWVAKHPDYQDLLA